MKRNKVCEHLQISILWSPLTNVWADRQRGVVSSTVLSLTPTPTVLYGHDHNTQAWAEQGRRHRRRVGQKVCQWLQQIDTYKLPLVPTSSKAMSKDAIFAVQKAADDIFARLAREEAQASAAAQRAVRKASAWGQAP